MSYLWASCHAFAREKQSILSRYGYLMKKAVSKCMDVGEYAHCFRLYFIVVLPSSLWRSGL